MESPLRVASSGSMPQSKHASMLSLLWKEDVLGDICDAVCNLVDEVNNHYTESRIIYSDPEDAPFGPEMLDVPNVTMALQGLAMYERRYLPPLEPPEEGEVDIVWESLGYEKEFDWSSAARVRDLADKAQHYLYDQWVIARRILQDAKEAEGRVHMEVA